jgi:hypothetical protein
MINLAMYTYGVVEPTELNTPLQIGEKQLLVICFKIWN